MDPAREKYAPTYDELPEVVQAPATAHVYDINDNSNNHHNLISQPWVQDGPAEKIVKYDNTGKEVAWNHMVNPLFITSPNDSSGGDNNIVSEDGVKGASHKTGHAELADGGLNEDQREKPRIICGIAARTFWFIVVVAVVVIAAAIGGGVGGAIAASRDTGGSGGGDSSAAEDNSISSSSIGGGSSSTTSPSTTPTTTPPSSSSSTPPPTPTGGGGGAGSTFNRFSFQAFESANFTGYSTAVIKVEGALALPFNSSSYVWQRNGSTCCTTFCAGKSWVGWWCQDKTQPSASRPFDNIEIGCSSEESEEYSRAKCAS